MKFSPRFLFFSLFVTLFLHSTLTAQISRPDLNRARTYDVQHYVIRTSFDRKEKTVYGDTTIELKPLSDNFKTFELDAVGMNFSSVKLEPQNTDLISRVADDKIYITLDRNYSPNDLIKVRLKYTSKPKKGVYFVDALEKNGKTVRASQVWTQGEAQEIRYWFPSFDSPNDKATTEQFITTEKGETAIANGELKEITENADGTRTFHYEMPLPYSVYLTSFVIGTYAKVEDDYNGIPLGFYVYPDKKNLVPKAYGKTKEMMRIYEELTGIKFPYNKYDQTMVAGFTFGGMENITATTMADTEILLADFKPLQGSVEDLVSHELSHSWFGNLVTCKNWSELWLNEGFATFMEAAYREKMYGRADYLRKIEEDANLFIIEETHNAKTHALFNTTADPSDDGIFDATTYQKGGAVIHTLRETIGDEAFWSGVNLYLKRHKFGNVESIDLQKALEETSKSNLEWFFAQWVYASGYPKLNVKRSYDTKTKTLELTLTQTQKVEGQTPEVFTLPLEIEIKTPNGKTQMEKISLEKREETFSFKLKERPQQITLDKNLKIPLKTVKMQTLVIK